MIRKLAWLYAAAFLVVGLLAFVPAASTAMPDGTTDHVMLLGLFQVNLFHNIVHLASAVLGGLAALTSNAASRLYFIAVGLGYGATTALAFVSGGAILGLTHMNMADNVIHLAIGASALAIGLLLPTATPAQA